MRNTAAILACLLAAPAAAHRSSGVEGDGHPTTQRREVPAFDRIQLEAAADVNVRVGGERSVSVTIDGNLQPLLKTEVKDGALAIRSDEGFSSRKQARVDVTVPVLHGFELAGSGDVAIDGGAGALQLAIEGSGDLRWQGEASELRASIEGSGDFRLEGRAEALKVTVAGSGNVHAAKLRAKDVSAKVDGSGDVDVSVDGGTFSASVSGSGDVRWRGQAKVESVIVTGTGQIARRD